VGKSERISEAEWQICQELWRHSPQTANEIAGLLAESNGWNHRTVRTLINRLVKKNVLGYESAEAPRNHRVCRAHGGFVNHAAHGTASAVVSIKRTERRRSDCE